MQEGRRHRPAPPPAGAWGWGGPTRGARGRWREAARGGAGGGPGPGRGRGRYPRHGGAARHRADPERLPGRLSRPARPGRRLPLLAARGADGRPGRARLAGVGSHRRHNVPPPRSIWLGDVRVHLLLDSNSPFLRDLPPAASAEVLCDPLASRANDLQCCGNRPVHHCLCNVCGRCPAYVLAAVGLQPESRGIFLRLPRDDRLWGEHLLQLPRLERTRQQRGHQPSDGPRVRSGQQRPALGHPGSAHAGIGGSEPHVPPGLVLGPACAGRDGWYQVTWTLLCGL